MERDPECSPQPYRQLAAALRVEGESVKADTILYVGRERDRHGANGAKRWWLTLLNYTIGYGLGHRYLRTAWWVLGMAVLGALVLSQCDGAMGFSVTWLLSCSLDLLIPIFEFGEGHYEFIQTVTGWPKAYFYFHQFVGYLLASLLIAGIAGLTQE